MLTDVYEPSMRHANSCGAGRSCRTGDSNRLTIGETVTIVIVSACHGERYWLVAEPWAKHLSAIGGCSIELVSLDGRAYSGHQITTILRSAKGIELKWGVGERFQIEQIIYHLQRGVVAGHLDLDIRLKRDFTALNDLSYDFIVSRAYGAPSFAVKKFGFVACLGAWIAKPSALKLCQAWLRAIDNRTYDDDMDQNVFNAMLCEAGPPRQERVSFLNSSLTMDVFTLEGATIGVLPKEVIERNLNKTAIFGNHDRRIFDQFVRQALWSHPLRASRELVSTSAVGPALIKLRNHLALLADRR